MKKLRVMVSLALLWACGFLTNASAQALVITEEFSADQVEYTILNTSDETLKVSYIVIQDDVLMLTTGEQDVFPGTSITVRASNANLNEDNCLLNYEVLPEE